MITERTHLALTKALAQERAYEERIIRVAATLNKWRLRRQRLETRIANERDNVNAVITRLRGHNEK